MTPDFTCYGRACRNLSVAITVPNYEDGYSLGLKIHRYGLGDEADALLNARPDWALPQQFGDFRLTTSTVLLPPNCDLAKFTDDPRCAPDIPEIEVDEPRAD